MSAEKYEGGNIPAHDKYCNGDSHDGCPQCIYITQILRSQEKRFCAKAFHEASINNGKKKDPEYQQDLVFSKMQKEELYGKGIIKSSYIVTKRIRVFQSETKILLKNNYS